MLTEKEIIQLRNDFEMISQNPNTSSMDKYRSDLIVLTLHVVLGIEHKANIALKIMEVESIWCKACLSFHPRPKDKLHHAELGCKGEYLEKP